MKADLVILIGFDSFDALKQELGFLFIVIRFKLGEQNAEILGDLLKVPVLYIGYPHCTHVGVNDAFHEELVLL